MSRFKAILGAAMKPILRETRVASVADVSSKFRLVVLEGASLKARPPEPGDKVQIMIAGDFRTYSPFAVDASLGRMSLLVYLHGTSPGAAWGQSVEEGDKVYLFGPRGSTDFRALTDPVLLVGDETSIGVARALQESGSRATAVLEVDSKTSACEAARAIGLTEVDWVEREANDGHLEALEARVRHALTQEGSSTLVLTGGAPTILALRKALRSRPVPHVGQKNKAYWAPGKRGLD